MGAVQKRTTKCREGLYIIFKRHVSSISDRPSQRYRSFPSHFAPSNESSSRVQKVISRVQLQAESIKPTADKLTKRKSKYTCPVRTNLINSLIIPPYPKRYSLILTLHNLYLFVYMQQGQMDNAFFIYFLFFLGLIFYD